jgi:hypothetical protein
VTSGAQTSSDAARLADGNVVVVWRSAENAGDIKAQLLDANGNRIGSEFRVNGAAANEQRAPGVAALPGGGFVVAWSEWTTALIRGQMFTDAGGRNGGEFSWSTDQPFAAPRWAAKYLSVAALANGNVAVAYIDTNDTAGQGEFVSPGRDYGIGVQLRVVSAAGAVGPQMRLDGGPPDARIDTAALASGNFVVAYSYYGPPTNTYGRVFAPNGTQIGDRFLISPPGNSFYPSVAALPNGGFLGSFTESTPPGAFGTVRIREFAANGAFSGIEQTIGTGRVSTIAVLDGAIAISAYEIAQDTSSVLSDIAVRSTPVGGQPTRTPVMVNEATAQTQAVASVIPLGSGRFMVIWNDNSGTGDPDGGIKARIFAT